MSRKTGEAHSHMWLVGMLGLASGLALMIYVPSLKPVSEVMFFFAGFHLVGGVVVIASLYMMRGGKLLPRRAREGAPGAHAQLDFGWAPSWTMGPLVASVVCLAAAVAIQVAAPHFWPLALLSTLLAANFFAGHLAAAATADPRNTPLPMVNLISGDHDRVLDGGCGAGRTTIALSRVLRKGTIVAMDKFDSDYIEEGGRQLLERNLAAASLTGRVEIKHGDLTSLPFPDGAFDAAVSAHAIDHLGPGKQKGLSEMQRVLKPSGKFLFVAWVPGWNMFAVASVLSLFLTGKAAWRRMTAQAGFEIQEEGTFNGVWYLLLAKPT